MSALPLVLSLLLGIPMAHASFEVKDDRGFPARFDENPGRVVCISPGATEIIFALGAERRLVAVSEFCDYPPPALKLERVGDFANPSLEVILATRPDLVVGTGGLQRELILRMRVASIPTLVLYPKGLEGVFSNITLLGKVLGEEEAASRLVAKLRARIERARNRIPKAAGASRPKVYLEVSSQPIMAVGKSSYAGELIELAGGINVAADAQGEYPLLSAEYLITADPDVIFLAHCDDPRRAVEFIARRPGWSELKAVRAGRVYADLDMDLLLRPGPRLVEGLEALISRLYFGK